MSTVVQPDTPCPFGKRANQHGSQAWTPSRPTPITAPLCCRLHESISGLEGWREQILKGPHKQGGKHFDP